MSEDFEEYFRKRGIRRGSALATPATGSVERRSQLAAFGGDESSGEMSTNAAKRMRTSFTSPNAADIISSSEEKMELIRWKGHVKMLESRISTLERQLEERYAYSEMEKGQQDSMKSTLEARISSLGRELSYVMDREGQALKRASDAEKLLSEERELAEARLRKLTEEKRLSEQESHDQCNRLRGENQTLHANYMEERRNGARFRHDCAQLNDEVAVFKRQNEELRDEVKTNKDQLAISRETNRGLQEDLRRFREECASAMAMREDLLNFNALKKENAGLKKQADRYKNMSENTLLLKEQNVALEEKVARLQKIQEQMVNENNELKAAIAKTSESVGQRVSFNDLDEMSRHCVDLKNEIGLLEQEIERLKQELYEAVSKADSLEDELGQQAARMEAEIGSRDQLLESLNERCADFQSSIAQKDVVINQFQKNTSELCARWKREREEKADLLKRLSPPATVVACQTEDMSTGFFASTETLQTALREKDAKIDYLESRFGLKLDYDPSETRVIHMEENPLSLARKEYAERLHAVESENHKLALRVKELEHSRQRPVLASDEAMDDDVTSKVSLRLNVEQMESEKQELLEKVRKLEEEKQKQKERMKEAHQTLTREYREVCTLLTGYQLKMKEGGLYVVQSVYERERENYFLIQKGEGNRINLLQNEYTPRWMDFVETYLMTDHSIPAFLAAVTLNLYEKDKDGSQGSFAGASASTSS